MSLLAALVQRSKQVADPVAQAYAAGNRPFTVRLMRPATAGTFDRATRDFVNAADQLLYQGPARIWTGGGGMELEIGDERTSFTSARCSLNYFDATTSPAEALELAPRVDDLLEVLDTPQGAATHLVGRSFTVGDVEVGGHFGTGWVLTLTGAAPSRRT